MIDNHFCTQEAGLRKYKIYGENNEQAQRILYELENDQSFKAFFVVRMACLFSILYMHMCIL